MSVKVLGIVGSPRRERGLCHQLVARTLEGARAVGAETDILYPIDERPEYCIHCGHHCFDTGDCAQDEGAAGRSQQLDAADALVIAAPVYIWELNGLTAAFLEKLRLAEGPWIRDIQHGRHALGIAVAGGSGTGVFPALQALYASLCHWKFRPLDPLPVTRFNLDRALEEAEARGRALATLPRRPFEHVGDLLLAYDLLPMMSFGHVDEFRWLAEQIAAGLAARGDRPGTVAEIARLLEEGRACAARGEQAAAARAWAEAYRAGLRAW